MKRLARAVFLVSFLGTLVSPSMARASDPPSAPNDQEARNHFLRGVDFSRDGDFRAALIEFRRAYELAPNYRVLYNIGQTALDLQDYAPSLEAFEKYLTEGGSEIPAARREQVEAEVRRLQSKVSQVSVVVSAPGASIFLDDVAVGKSPLDHPLRVGAGRHKFSASSPDSPLVSRVVDVTAGESTTVELELGPVKPVVVVAPEAPRPSPTPAPPPAAKDEPSPSRTALWIGIGTTGALAVGTIVAGVLAQSAKSSFESELGHYPGNASEISNARSSLRTTALVFDITAVATLVAGGVTAVIALSGTPNGSRPAPQVKGLASW